MSSVLDASALVALALDEPGAAVVESAIAEGAAISTVNLAEALSRLFDVRPDLAAGIEAALGRHAPPSALASLGPGAPLWLRALTVEPFAVEDAVMCAALRPVTRAAGLSLGDRACLALGRRLGWPVLTADTAWLTVPADALRVEVRHIRPPSGAQTVPT